MYALIFSIFLGLFCALYLRSRMRVKQPLRADCDVQQGLPPQRGYSDCDHPLGGATQRRSVLIPTTDISRYRVYRGCASLLKLQQNVSYHSTVAVSDIPRSTLWDESPFRVAITVPLKVLAPRLPMPQLLALCSAHDIPISGKSAKSLDNVLQSHSCHTCPPSCAVFTLSDPLWVSYPVVLHGSFLQQFTRDSRSRSALLTDARYQFQGLAPRASVSVREDTVYVDIDLFTLCALMPAEEIRNIAAKHSLSFALQTTREEMLREIAKHDCQYSSCVSFIAVLSPVSVPKSSPSITQPRTSARSSEPERKFWGRAAEDIDCSDTYPFPPPPTTAKEHARIASSWCKELRSEKIEEHACAACARLTKRESLSTVKKNSIDLSVLQRAGERVAVHEAVSGPPVELSGPILLHSALHETEIELCSSCLSAIKKGVIPRLALANGIYVGEVPDVLKDLRFVEKLVIARRRHNAFMVEVRRGQRKMRANAVTFTQPVEKVYDELPPPREDLDATLAILFTGSCAPTEDDLDRTPFLVRHNAVRAALHWLRVNHSDYANVVISENNLSTYPSQQLPVNVIFRETDGSLGTESLSGYHDDTVQGTREGACPFTVQGLVGKDVATLSYAKLLSKAVKHFQTGGRVLSYGHDNLPDSIFHDPTLFPSMFPWLFPYGLGGFDNLLLKKTVPRRTHIQHLLLYDDRRFQTDEYFAFVAFNHLQIRDSSRGGFLLTDRHNFPDIARRILQIDIDALDRLISRGGDIHHCKPEGVEEQACFELLSHIDYVAGHVDGSITSRKYMRNEIKSLIMAEGVPMFFITFSPVDFKHPMCIYLCGETVSLDSVAPMLPASAARLRLIAHNPVACARFFDTMVTTFLTHVLCADVDEVGIFGKTTAYYGTVEQQGRLTLHLHLLIWIANAFSPQQVRDTILTDIDFRARLLCWLESCHRGDFHTGTDQQIHDRLLPSAVSYAADEGEFLDIEDYLLARDPVTCLPRPPPATDDAAAVAEWHAEMLTTADNIVYLSNRHDPEHRKGCMRGKPRQCRARFPRELFPETQVDDTGAIRFRKHERWINSFNPVVSFLLRCNSDVTCLLSGTQVRAVIAYVTDYITKSNLNTRTVFQTVREAFQKQNSNPPLPGSDKEAARRMITRIVNSLTAKSDIGAPFICAHLLGQPDHYTNRHFKTVYWMTYLRHIQRELHRDADAADIEHAAGTPLQAEYADSERVVIGYSNENVVALSRVNDYLYRPVVMENWSLHDFLARADVKRVTARRKRDKGAEARDCAAEVSLEDNEEDQTLIEDDVVEFGEDIAPEPEPEAHRETGASGNAPRDHQSDLARGFAGYFVEPHPNHATHGCHLLPISHRPYTLNFVGGALPRPDKGDRELYCLTMLILFYPTGWRTAKQLRGTANSWSEVFQNTTFSEKHIQIMKNLNVLNECKDARDDFAAQRRAEQVHQQYVTYLEAYFGPSRPSWLKYGYFGASAAT